MSVTSSDLAGGNGIPVTLTVADPSIASAPTSVTIPANTSSTTFLVTGAKVGNTSISASASGHTAYSAAVTVRQKQIVLPASVLVPAGQQVSFPVIISDPAPIGGLTINLSTHDPFGTVSSSVVIRAGSQSATALANDDLR
jgi:hypothetical protein